MEMVCVKTAHKGINWLWLLMIAMLLMCCMTFGASAEVDSEKSGTNELDGSKIEDVKVFWITQDSEFTAEGIATPQEEIDNAAHLYVAPVSNDELKLVYQIEAELSGQYDYQPGDITITIPAQVWHARKYEAADVAGEMVGVENANKLQGYLELPLPAAPSQKADFNWQIINGNYVLTNTRTISAASSVSINVAIRGVRPIDLVDMSHSEPISARIEVVTHQGNTIALTSEEIVAQIDTQAKITSVFKDGEVFESYPGLDAKLLDNLPEGTKPEDYVYVRWYTYHSHDNTQPYSLDIADVLCDAYELVENSAGDVEKKFITEGIVLGSTNYDGQILSDGDVDFTAEIGDRINNATTGVQYANTVHLWSAYLKSAFEVPNATEPQRVYYLENEVEWILTETDKTVTDATLGKGEDLQKVTREKDTATLSYAPIKWKRPNGEFAVFKWTEQRSLKDWLYGNALNTLENREEVDMEFIVETVGYGYPWTSRQTQGFSYDELNNTEKNDDLDRLDLDESSFGKLGWKQVTDDFRTFFNFEDNELTSEDFEIRSLRVSVPVKQRYDKLNSGSWDYVTDSTLPTPDLVIEYQLDNDNVWRHAATATWGEDGQGPFAFIDVAENVSTSDMTLFFPENVTDVRQTFTTNVFGGKTAEHCDIAMIDWRAYPTITLKPSDRIYQIVQALFDQSEGPSTKFKNDVTMDVYGWLGEDGTETLILSDDFDYSIATLEGASYGVSMSASSSHKNDVENQRLMIHYTAKLTEQSNLQNREEYDAAVESGVIPAETSGIWYDLLPPHVVPLLDTVTLREGDIITNLYTIENYKDSGRTLLVVEAKLKPVPSILNTLGYADQPTLNFEAAYTWMDYEKFGEELVNYVAFESTTDNLRNDTLGTILNQKGEPDTPAGGNNATTPSMPVDIIRTLTDLDPNTDENRFVYGKTSNMVGTLTYEVSGLKKMVKNNLMGIWAQGLDGQDQVTVYEGQHYTYRLHVSSADSTYTKGIVIFDDIEGFVIPDPSTDANADVTKREDFAHTQARLDWTGDWDGKGQWHGTLVEVDLSELVKAGVKPVLLYSQTQNLGSYDISDRMVWQAAELDENGLWIVPDGLNVSSVAIDATISTDGSNFVLQPKTALTAYLKMRAPDDAGSEEVWNAKGAYARLTDENGSYLLDEEGVQQIDWTAAMHPENNMYAYNNTFARLCRGYTNDTNGSIDWEEDYQIIHNDYTRVGIVPKIITVEKEWQDQDDHDAIRPDSVTVSVLRRLAGTADKAEPVRDEQGNVITAVLNESNGWKAEFTQMSIVNEAGMRYLYSFEEEPVPGYESSVQFNGMNSYTLINVHPNEQVTLEGVKLWEDNSDALGLRPDQVTLNLYRDGEMIDSRTVKANRYGECKYSFGKQDKYSPGGKEYIYHI